MPDLHLIGVHEDGAHLILAGSGDGEQRHLLPIDDALRSAVRRRAAGGPQGASPEPLRPVDVQAMIRAGASAEEAAERAGWPVEKVHRYEGPILAERVHVAMLAGRAHVRDRTGQVVTLLDRVNARLTERGVDPQEARWDAWRSQDGQWNVDVAFAAGGRQRTASWHFSRSAMSVDPVDEESRWITGDGESPSAPVQRGGSAVQDSPRPSVSADGGEPRRIEQDPDVGLTGSLRERAAARSTRRRAPRRPPTDASGKPTSGGSAAIAGGGLAGESHPTAPASAPPTVVPSGSASPTTVPSADLEPPSEAASLAPLGDDPATTEAPTTAHPVPDADGTDGPDGSPEPGARADEPESTADAEPNAEVAPSARPAPNAEAVEHPPALREVQKVQGVRPGPKEESVTPTTPSISEPPGPADPEPAPRPADTEPASRPAETEPAPRRADPEPAPRPADTEPAPADSVRDRSVASETVEEPQLPLEKERAIPPRSGKRPGRKGRSSVPAWDDIIFGAKPPE